MRARTVGAGLTFNVVVLSLVSFFTDMSSEIIFPLLPIFLTVELGATALIVGVMEGLAESTASVLQVFSGHYSDKIGKRKRLVGIGYGLSALTKPLFIVVNTWMGALGLRVAERVGKATRNPPRDAILADSVSKERRGLFFGFHRAMDTAGAILGPILIIVLLPLVPAILGSSYGYRTMFLIAVVPAVVAFLLVFLVREIPPRAKAEKKLTLGLRSLPKNLRRFIGVATLYALGNFSFFFIILITFGELENEVLTITYYLIFNVVYALLSIPAGALSDRIGRRSVIGVGYATFAIACIGFVLVIRAGGKGVEHYLPLFLLCGVSYAFVEAVQRSYVSDMSPAGLKATSLGTYHTSVGVAKLPASIIAGVLWLQIDPTATFAFGAITSFLALSLLSLGCRKSTTT